MRGLKFEVHFLDGTTENIIILSRRCRMFIKMIKPMYLWPMSNTFEIVSACKLCCHGKVMVFYILNFRRSNFSSNRVG